MNAIAGLSIAVGMIIATLILPVGAAPKPKVRYLDCPRNFRCPACEDLKAMMHRKNAHLNFQQRIPASTDPSPSAYPTAHYTKGKSDHGEKVRNDQAEVPNYVEVVEWE